MIKINLLSLLFTSLLFIKVFSQEREKEPHYNYITISTSVYTNTPGSFNEKFFISSEFGRTYGIFDIGIAEGRLNLVKAKNGMDSNWFVEARPTINVFSKGRFSESLTLGAGYIFNRKENFLTEITNCINFAPNDKLSVSVCQGNYFFDGRLSTSKTQFIALAVTFNFIKKNSNTDKEKRKSLLN